LGRDVAPPLREGRYRLVAMVGSGASATVYRAFDTRLEVYRAVKLLHDRHRRDVKTRHRFEEEAAVIASLRHRNIVTVYDIDAEQGKPFIVMDYAPGGSLMQRIDRLGSLEPTAAVHTMIDVLDALQTAHERGIIHRDVKPHNILFGIDDVPLLTDFGVALRVDERTTPRTRSRILGTPTYMSPEQAHNSESAGPRSDVYSAGLCLYVMMTGRQPFAGHEVADAREELEQIDPRLAEIVMRSCSPSADNRYSTAAAMADALCEVGAALPVFRPETLHTPGTAPLRYLAPPSMPPMDETWPPGLRSDGPITEDSAPPSMPTPERFLESPSFEASERRSVPPVQSAPINPIAVTLLVLLFVGASATTWFVLNRVVPAIAAP
jgi:serine/threonine-protein kinase